MVFWKGRGLESREGHWNGDLLGLSLVAGRGSGSWLFWCVFATSVLGVDGEAGSDPNRCTSQPSLSSSDSEMTFLTSFSCELIVVCKHELCH